MSISLFGAEGNDADNIVKSIIPNDGSPVVGKEYSVDSKFNLLVLANPK